MSCVLAYTNIIGGFVFHLVNSQGTFILLAPTNLMGNGIRFSP